MSKDHPYIKALEYALAESNGLMVVNIFSELSELLWKDISKKDLIRIYKIFKGFCFYDHCTDIAAHLEDRGFDIQDYLRGEKDE